MRLDPRTVVLATCTLALAALLGGCMSWTRGWETPARSSVLNSNAEVEARIRAAREAFEAAGSEAELNEVRLTLRGLLAERPDSGEALLVAAHTEILFGAAYDQSRGAKKVSYRRGIQFAERAMATDPEFKQRVASGATLAEAVDSLGNDQAEAKLLWVTGVSYYFKECLSLAGRLINFRWMLRTSEVMHHLNAVSPNFKNGAVPFSLGIYYLALPESAGGDVARAGELLQVAVDQAKTSLLPRWGRAKYYWVKTGNREGFRSDLEWVLAQAPHAAVDSSYSWNVYFQRDARQMLEQIDSIF